ncbi:hypothetical protein Z043_122799 [Scleropages formosus]|uniref:Protein SSUH2-like n=1 Tax=Scleropages formosus TaxID=113540 RepID=A0A0P7TYU0_SCLFO|nr:hypothetical protein Z043_122799 [Scleropages formosus]
MSKDAAHAAFKEYVSGKCCYGSGPADEGVITNMEALNTYRYRLETFTESRSTEWNHEPFNGQPIDAYMQPAPGPWAIPVQPPSVFQDSTQVVKVPYTSSVKDCHDCQGKGKTPCKNCSGAGNQFCVVSNPKTDSCSDCKGEGVNLCDTCKGKRQLLVFINLKVQCDQDEATGGTTPNQQHPAVAAAGADDPNKGEGDMASAPPAELMDVVPGYEGIGSAGHSQTVDGFLGVAPGPWDLNVPVPALFQNGSEKVRIPYTSSVKMQCSVCNGSGRNLNDRCTRCSGAGRVRCTICSGVGSLTCKTCKGKGQLLCYIKLTVKWKNNLYECVVDKQSGFPIDKISKVTGETMFTDMNARVYPVVGFPDDAINRASVQAVREHQAQFASTSRILQQRQTIELIPITRVHYSWRNKTYIYFVFGAEHKVHTDDYPAKCCCCSIL